MAKGCFIVLTQKANGDMETACFYDIVSAQSFFRNHLKDKMMGEYVGYYNGANPKSGWFHKLKADSYVLYQMIGSSKSIVFRILILNSCIYKKEDNPNEEAASSSPVAPATPAAGGGTGHASAPVAPSPVASAAGPVGSVGPKGVPAPVGSSSPAGKTTVVVGGKSIEIDQAVLTAALGAALAGAGVVGGSGDEDGDEEDEEDE